MSEIEKPSKHVAFDSLHRELLHLLDQIEVQEASKLAHDRFAIMTKYGYTTTLLNGPRGLVK